jgi:hypothetical protein
VDAFLAKVASLPSDAPPPPATFMLAPENGNRKHAFMQRLLRDVKSLVPGCESIDSFGGVAGLGCTMLQFGRVSAVLRALEFHPWFSAVLATGAALQEPLATLVVPKSGCDVGEVLRMNCVIWV